MYNPVMPPKTENVLRKAIAQIRGGKASRAQRALVELLRREPDNAQAWYLLSFTLDDPQRQQYALTQALRVDPEFEKAKTRLQILRGEPVDAPTPQMEKEGETAAPPIVMELEEKKPVPAFIEETGKASFTEPKFEKFPSDKPKPRSRRVLIFILVILLILVLAYAVITYMPGITTTPASPTVVASRTLPATWTPTIEPTATVTLTPSRTATLEPTETVEGSVTPTQ